MNRGLFLLLLLLFTIENDLKLFWVVSFWKKSGKGGTYFIPYTGCKTPTVRHCVTVIQFREHNGMNNVLTSISVNKTKNLLDVSNVSDNRVWEICYMLQHEHVLIKHNTKVGNGVRLRRNFWFANQQCKMSIRQQWFG